MINQVPLMLVPVELTLLVTSCTLLVGLLFGRYWRSRFLPKDVEDASLAGEKRRSWRVRSGQILELGDAAGRFAADSAKLINLSLGGLCFASPIPLRRGEDIQVKLHSYQGSPVVIRGRVVWLNHEAAETLYGLQIRNVRD